VEAACSAVVFAKRFSGGRGLHGPQSSKRLSDHRPALLGGGEARGGARLEHTIGSGDILRDFRFSSVRSESEGSARRSI
jgi:hypothetical protein